MFQSPPTSHLFDQRNWLQTLAMAPFFHDLSILSLNGNVCWWPEVGTVMCWSHWNRYTFTTDLRLDIPPPLSGDSHRSNIASHCSRIWGYMWPLTSGVLLYTVIGANHWAQQATTTHQKKKTVIAAGFTSDRKFVEILWNGQLNWPLCWTNVLASNLWLNPNFWGFIHFKYLNSIFSIFQRTFHLVCTNSDQC